MLPFFIQCFGYPTGRVVTYIGGYLRRFGMAATELYFRTQKGKICPSYELYENTYIRRCHFSPEPSVVMTIACGSTDSFKYMDTRTQNQFI